MNISVYELLDLFVDKSMLEIKVYNLHKDAECIYSGCADDIPLEIEDMEICSIDNIEKDGILGINIDSSEI